MCWSILSCPFNVDWSILSYYIKKCSALVENLISKKYPMFLVGLSYFLLSYGANIMKKVGSAKFIYKKRETF